MYPLQEHYLSLIRSFIEKVQTYTDLKISAGSTATVIIGEYARVMTRVTEMVRWSYEEHGWSVFVAELIPGYEPE